METTHIEKNKYETRDRLRRYLYWLLLGRPVAVLLALLASYAMHRFLKGAVLFDSVRWVAVVTMAATVVFALGLHLCTNYRLQAYLQMLGDIFLVTWMVWLTGSIQSPFFVFYLILIVVISRVSSRRSIYALTGVIISCYLFLISRQHETTSLIHQSSVATNLFAIIAIAFLSIQLSEQETRTDADLAEAKSELRNIRVFSERVIDSISSGLVTIDLQHNISSLNRAAEEIVGYKAEDIVGQHLNVLFPTIAEQIEAGKATLMTGHNLSRLNLECATADGRQIQLGFSISPLTTVTGEINGFVLPFQDLTDVMRLERDVRRQDRLAALGRVAAAIAHEIRNPLASMRGAVQVLGSDSKLSDEEAQLMNIVLRESDRIDRIISDFLMYARPRQPELEPVNLNDLLEETLTLLRFNSEIDSQNYQLLAAPCAEPPMVMADPGQLRQVLWNLARNSIKAMPDGGTFTIAINRDAEGKHYEVKFIDTGVGMTEEQIERIFEPFSSFSAGGTGLGMSIVYHIINEHRGKIDVTSELGKGTTITIRLTACIESHTEEKAVSASIA